MKKENDLVARAYLGFLAVAATLLNACAHVPREAVQLSYQIGQDLPRLYDSYDRLIEDRFNDFRAQRETYLNNVWTPEFLSRWIEKARLLDIARGSTVWSFENASFVSPTPGREKVELLSSVQEWSSQAVTQIQKKRKELIDPLDRDEEKLRGMVREAFDRIIQANSYITAHLASVRHVEEAQNEALEALNLKDLRDKINDALVKASETAASGLEQVRKADGLVDKGSETLHHLR